MKSYQKQVLIVGWLARLMNLYHSCTGTFPPLWSDDGAWKLWPVTSVNRKILYCIMFVSDDLSVLSGSNWVGPNLNLILFFSFSFLNPNSSSLPCLWCWQCYTSIRQRFVNVFHQLHSCMFCLALSLWHLWLSSRSRCSWCPMYKLFSGSVKDQAERHSDSPSNSFRAPIILWLMSHSGEPQSSQHWANYFGDMAENTDTEDTINKLHRKTSCQFLQ